MMNERIRELAKQAIANVYFWNAEKEVYEVDHAELIEFAELVAQQEREACAKVCEELGMATNGMHERNHGCAQAIRARGETK
jgi:hypothetical protein